LTRMWFAEADTAAAVPMRAENARIKIIRNKYSEQFLGAEQDEVDEGGSILAQPRHNAEAVQSCVHMTYTM
jgi:hypothetical protein